MTRYSILLLLLLLSATPLAAQYEDDQTQDHEEMDRRYQERYQQKQAEPEPPPADPEAEHEAFLAKVDELIRDRNYRAASSDRYRVQTDDPRLNPDGAVQLLESFRSFFEEFWSGRVELEAYDKQSRVFLFYSFFKYNQLLAQDFRFSEQRPAGHYGSWFDALTVHTDANAPGDLADTLIHEAAHQLVDQQFPWRTGQTSTWLAEGLASYFGFTLMKDGEFVPGQIGNKQASLFRAGKVGGGKQASVRLSRFRELIRSAPGGEDSITERVLWAGPGEFYGENAAGYYAASWILIHYLLHGDGGAHADAFSRFLAAEMRDQGGPELLLSEIGLSGAELDSALAGYARRLKVR
jgi:hypothetical protein